MKPIKNCIKRYAFRKIIAYILLCCMFLNTYLPVAWAGPEDAEIINGQVLIQQTGYNTVIIASDNSIINYSSFDILQPEIVEFIQPGSSASVLNRILSANPTNINGTLLANGRVFFVNPAGVYIGAGARINVNQLIASGLDISNSDFINGRYNFAGGDGSVINFGDILADQVYLIGKQVANSGNISCPDGYVVMAAGDRVFLGEPGSDIVLEIDATPLPEKTTPTDLEAAVLNEGTVEATGGTIVLAAAGDIYSQAISNVGSLSVSTETDEAGQIKLLAPNGQITNTGSIEASGDTGGSVTIDGGDVVLTADSVIHADGMTADAGDISIHGTSTVEVGSGVLLTADAQDDAGDGGSVIVLGDEMAIFEGTISAQGGRSEGDGGFAEVSGKHVKVGGHADLTAAAGQTGEFLIDPGSVNIIDGDDTAPDMQMDTFNDGWIESQLGLSLLTIDTTDSDNSNAEVIDFAGDASVGWATGNEFKLKAGERIDFRGTVSSTGGGNFVMDSPTVDLYSSNITVSGGGELSGTATTVNVKSDAVSIGTGIAVADNTGATINVAAGTYTEDLTIDKSVTLEGAQAGVAVPGRIAGGTSESTIVGEHTITGSTVTIDGFTLSDPDLGSGNVLISLDSSGVAIDDVTLTNNFVELGSEDVGIDFGGNSSTNQAITNIAIEDSVFSGPGDKISNPMRIGGWFGTDYDIEVGGVTFQRNTVNYGSIPIQLQDDNLDNITITQNTFTNTDGTVYVWGNNASPMGILSNFEYSENSVDSTNTYGVGIDVFDVFGNSNLDDTIAIINNSFDGVTGNYGFNAVSILSSAFTGTIDASGNWYGTNTAAEVVGEVSANVDYTPWLDSGTDTDPVTPGFQGDFSTLHVSATSPQSGVLGRIDEAIGLATIGGKINAMAGTYNETINVNKNLAGIYFEGTSEIDGTVTLNANLDIYTQNDGDLTLNTIDDGGIHSLSVDTGDGALNLDENVTANGGITLAGGIINVGDDTGDKITSDGAVSIVGIGAIAINAAIDPSAVAITSNSDLTINNSITADDLITVDAGLVGGVGNVILNSTGSLETTAVGSDIQITAGATMGDISLAGNVTATDVVTVTAPGGSILDTGSGMIASDSANLLAKTDIGSAANSVNTSISSLTADAGGGIYIDETDGLTSANLHSIGGDVDLTAGGTVSSSTLTADVGNVDAETPAGDINNTTVNAAGTATLDAAGSINNASVTAGLTAILIADTDISVFDVDAAAVNLTATGQIVDIDADVDITATTAILNAGSSIGSAVNPVNTEITSLISLAGEHIYIHETDAIELVDIDTSDGDIHIKAGGQMTATDVEAGGTGNISLTTTGTGDVIMDEITALDDMITINSAGMIGEVAETEPAVDLTAYELNFDAESGIHGSSPIETSAEIITADTTNGDIDIDNVNSNPVTAGSLTTGNGNILFSQSGGGSLEVTTASTSDGNVNVDVTGTDANLKAGDITAGGLGNIDLKVTEGEITQDSGTITANGGSLIMTQRDALDTKDFTFANQSNTDITLQSYNGSVTAVDLANGGKDENAADKWKSITATAEDNILLQGNDDIKIDGDLTSASGGVSIISDNGGIYDAGSYDYSMTSGTVLDNVNISGYSDGTAGVNLPAGSGKAAIIIQSKKDLKLGQNCDLTAEGSYDPTSDERQDVIFELDGDPIDIAIYLSSFDSDSGTGANVDIGSSRISINNSSGEGTLVIDAYDTVTFTDTFENSLKLAGASDIKRLEATSRITPDLQTAINLGTLPHADNPAGIADGEFVLSGGVYVLRGPASLLAKASILALTGPVPLVPPVPLEAEDRGEVEEDDRDALMQWLVEELGESNVQTYLARAYPPSLNTDLRPYKAAARLRNFATIIKDTEGDHIAALTQVVNEFIATPVPPSEEQMALIVSALTEQPEEGTHYAAAGQWIEALVEYVGVLNTEIGWSSEKSVAFVMNKYGSRLTEGGDIRAAMFVQMYMEESFGG